MSVVIWWMKIAVTLQLPQLAYQQIRVKDMTWNAIVEFAGQRTIKGHIGDKLKHKMIIAYTGNKSKYLSGH